MVAVLKSFNPPLPPRAACASVGLCRLISWPVCCPFLFRPAAAVGEGGGEREGGEEGTTPVSTACPEAVSKRVRKKKM